MKIVHVINCCSSAGAEVLAKNILKNIKQIDKDIAIELWVIYKASVYFNENESAIEFENKFIDELKEYGIRVRFIDKKKNFFSRINVILNIRKLYNKFKPDLIHCHLESVTFHVVTSLMFKKVKIVETIHNTVINKPKIQKYYLNKRVDKLVAISEKVRKIMLNELGTSLNKIELIYNGIDLDKFRNKNIMSDKVEKILAVGRLTKQKDHITLIKAFELVKEKCINNGIDVPILQIAGDGELKEEILNYKKEKGLNELKLLGVVQDIESLFVDHQIYVMSSIYEGLSLSLMEASVSGVSVICTDVGSNDEIIIDNNNGILVEKKDYKELAEKIYLLINDLELRKRLTNNTKFINNNFSIKECARNHIITYKSLIKGCK